MRGGHALPPTPELKLLIWTSSGPDQYKFILWYNLSFLWKFKPAWSTLRGGLNWSFTLWHPRYLHSLNLYFGLDINFWRNTLLKFIQVATPVGDNMVYKHNSALMRKYWHILVQLIGGCISPTWIPYYTNDTTGTPDVILKPVLSDLVCARWFLGQIACLQINIWYWFGLIYMYFSPFYQPYLA